MKRQEKNCARRVLLLVLDSLGIGELPDAEKYHDQGSNTISHIALKAGGLKVPALEKLGLGLIEKIQGVRPVKTPRACYGKMAEKSPGKDTTTGHWEIAGIHLTTPFPLYPSGFPAEVLHPFEEAIGRGVLGNIPASGTEIICDLGEEHILTGKPIVYTSADSVFQIAAHKEVIPLQELYRMCKIARSLLSKKPHNVSRIIARPFTGSPGSFVRTWERKDFSLEPPNDTVLDVLHNAGYPVIGIGKIGDIFAHRGLTSSIPTSSNSDGIAHTIRVFTHTDRGLVFTNLIDFDMLYGHRNDLVGYALALEEFDSQLPRILELISDNDLLIITADHGCDPTHSSTDHTREYVPLLVYSTGMNKGTHLGVRKTFADIAATIADFFSVRMNTKGLSILPEMHPFPRSDQGHQIREK